MIRKTVRIKRYEKCFRCQGTNTQPLADGGATTESERYVYLGWCRDCLDSYAYREWVDDIHDPQGRI